MTSGGRICFLHMGTGKTGSSAIQLALTERRAELAKSGLLYPDAADNFRKVLVGSPTAGNGLTINKLLHAGNISAALDVVSRYSRSSDHLVFSCEGFSNVKRDFLKTFAQGLSEAGYEAKSLVIFRPQADRIVSSYLQQIKANKIQLSLDEFAEQILSTRLGAGYNWYLRARKLESAFGRANLKVHWYPALRRRGLDGVPAAAFEWLGVPTIYSASQSSQLLINPTPSREALIVLQEVTAKGLGGRNFADKFLQSALERKIRGSKVALNPSLIERIHAATIDSNKKLLEEYCVDLDPASELRLPDPGNDTAVSLDEDALTALRQIAMQIGGRQTKLFAAAGRANAAEDKQATVGPAAPRCIIHVGMHKTGSTSIQMSLAGHEDDQFIYANLGENGNHSLPIYSLFASRPELHHIHRAQERDHTSLQRYIEGVQENLEAELRRAGNRTLLISGEDISVLSRDDLAKLADYFGARVSELRIVAYVRPPVGLMNSRFQQLVKGGAIDALDFNRIYHGYQRLFAKIDAVFGRDHVQLWKFDPGAFPQADVVRDFCERVGINLSAHRTIRANESLSRGAVALLYSYAKCGAQYSQSKFRGPEAMRLGRLVGGHKFRFSPTLLHSVLKQHEADISWMERRLGQSLDEDIGPERPGDVREEADLLRPDPKAIAQLLNALGPRRPEGLKGETAAEVAQLVAAWRQATLKPKRRWYTRINIIRWFMGLGAATRPRERHSHYRGGAPEH